MFNIQNFMKYLFPFIILLLIGPQNLLAQGNAQITFDTTRYDYGVVQAGAKAEYFFAFTNTGDVDLNISDVKTTCFCTASEWPTQPIPPGGKGTIRVNFDTVGKNGPYAKGVNVFSNAGESNLIIFIEVLGVEVAPVVEPESHEGHDHEGHDHKGHNH